MSLALGCLQHQLFSGTNSAHCRGAAFLGFLSLWHGPSLTEASPVRPWGLPTAPVVLAQPRGVAPCEHSAHLPRGPLPSALKPFLSSAPPPPSQLSVCSTQCGRCVDPTPTPAVHSGGRRPLSRVPSPQGSRASTACLLTPEGTSHAGSSALLVILAGWLLTLLLHGGRSLAEAWHLRGSPRQGARARGLPSAPWISQQRTRRSVNESRTLSQSLPPRNLRRHETEADVPETCSSRPLTEGRRGWASAQLSPSTLPTPDTCTSSKAPRAASSTARQKGGCSISRPTGLPKTSKCVVLS